MSKVLFFLILPIIFLSFLITKPAYATILPTYHQPNPIYVNSDKIFVYVTSDKTLPPSNIGTYHFRAWPQSKGEFSCGIGGATNAKTAYGAIDEVKREDGSLYELVANWEVGKCKELGNWNFKLWVGSSDSGPSDEAGWLVKNYSFEMEQEGGRIPKIMAQKDSYALAEDPYVLLLEARATQTYTFWWENGITQRLIAAQPTIGTDGNQVIKLSRDGLESGPGNRTLCMLIGPVHTVFGLTCDPRFKTVFHFTLETKPPGESTCRIAPSDHPDDTDTVSLTGTNITPLKLYRADLTRDETTEHKGSLYTEGDVVTISLGKSLPQGSYTATLYKDEDSSFVCEKEFTVGAKAPPTIAPLPNATCDPTKTNCSSGAGKSCDGTGENAKGIQTAIGCIHTAPVAFIKDFLTFITAIAGGLAFLMMLIGAFQMMTSAGNPDTLHAGRDRLTNAIIGLLIIIFAVLLMQIIGVDILGILPK